MRTLHIDDAVNLVLVVLFGAGALVSYASDGHGTAALMFVGCGYYLRVLVEGLS